MIHLVPEIHIITITITISLLDNAFDKIQSSYVSLNVRSLNRYFNFLNLLLTAIWVPFKLDDCIIIIINY